ncbi:MAG: hypothetical protein HY000_21870 [Planctomycetes bacterium]|nr:hypothetical protein [Planctomycetota bacterium]
MLHGQADVIRSRGEADLLDSEAIINVEEARRLNIENDLLYTQTYFEKRQINESHRLAENQAHRRAQPGVADPSKPVRPTADQLDPASAIHWPEALQGNEYTEMRQKIEALFAERLEANRNGAGTMNHERIKRAAVAMHAELRKHVHEVPIAEYVNALKLLNSMSNEPQFAPANGRVASR